MTDRVFIAMPSYGGQPCAETVMALVNALAEAAAIGQPASLRLRPRDSLLPRARNLLAQQFLDSGAETLVFWDDDVGCQPGDFARLLQARGDLVAGAYRYRSDPQNFPILPLAGGWRGDDGLYEVEAVPAGFLKISRAAIEAMVAARPDAWFHDGEVGRAPILFENVVEDHQWWGEDFTFCRRARAAGLRVWIDPRVRLTHTGAKVFVSDFSGWLGRQFAARATPDDLAAARARLEAAFARAETAA